MYHAIKNAALIAAGVLAEGFGLKGFLLQNSFIEGGVTGVSLLVSILAGLPLGLLLISINLPFIILGFTLISRSFAIKSIIAICGLAVCVQVIDFPMITSDKLLIYLASAKTTDFIIDGIEEYTGVTIVSSKPHEIRRLLTEKLGRGVTMYQGKGGYGQTESELMPVMNIYTVVTRLEVSALLSEIDAIDEKAFITMNSIRDTRGGMIKKRTIKDR